MKGKYLFVAVDRYDVSDSMIKHILTESPVKYLFNYLKMEGHIDDQETDPNDVIQFGSDFVGYDTEEVSFMIIGPMK